jgi:phage replication-related protein YjqB (UPF0714/DUF867 family)
MSIGNRNTSTVNIQLERGMERRKHKFAAATLRKKEGKMKERTVLQKEQCPLP